MPCPSCGALNDEGAEVCFHCRALLSAVTRGTVLGGRYEILTPLGRGGMGAVYRARDRVLEEEVAVKVLRADVAGTEERARRFRSEIKLARRVSHWNVCRIYEYGEDGPLRFISMELVEGETLKDALRRRGALPAAEAFETAIQVAEGLGAVHQAGVVHRDLKSANIMLDRTGRIRVMDFGIAKREAEAGSAASGYVVGSPEYMSPEQARGVPVDARSDLYALGVVVFEAFTGDVPFRADTPVGTLLLHLEAPPPVEKAPIPPALRPVLRRALAKDPSERFGSAREMAEALRAAREEVLGKAAVSGGAPGQDSARIQTRSRAVWWLAVALALVAGLALLRTWVPEPAEPIETASPLATTPAPPLAATATTSGPESPPTPAARRRDLPRPPPPRSIGPVPVGTPTPESPASPEPTAPPGTLAAPNPAATPPPSPSPTSEPDGALLVLVTPWADVSVDGRPRGQTPLARIPLPPGPHAVLLTHPDFAPFPRRVTIRAGETIRLVVDLPSQGVRRAR